MATIRAYKLAEELGIDRHEFVDKAAAVGVEVKSAMASLDGGQVSLLREKLGRGGESGRRMEERRVEGKRGTTVLRRRKRTQKEPEPEPEPAVVEERVVEATEDEPQGESTSEVSEVSNDEDSAEAVDTVSESGEPPEVSEEPEIEQPLAASESPQPASENGERKAVAPSTPVEPSGGAGNDRKGRQRKRVREVVNLQEQERFARQITGRGAAPRRPVAAPSTRQPVNPRRKRRDKLAPAPVVKPASEQKRLVKVEGEISVGELAKLLGAKSAVVQGKLMALGTMVSVNQTVDIETARQVAQEFGFEVQDTGFKEETFLEPLGLEEEVESAPETAHLTVRAPVITVMGHVDHGKTSLLDAIRDSKKNVADQEAGGITQHIGAYQVGSGEKRLTFIDTPGHAAFTAMRARGASVTDMVVLVVAANDGVMPQTVEAIEHAQAAGCPIVVAINKMDLTEADPEKVKQRLTEHGLVAEDFGGDMICCNVSAKTGDGIGHLLDMLALQAELLELRSDPSRRAKGIVLDARLDKGRGPVATVLVQDGTLQRGDAMVVGTESGRLRARLHAHTSHRLKTAGW